MGSNLVPKDILANPVINMMVLHRIKNLKYLEMYDYSVFKRVTITYNILIYLFTSNRLDLNCYVF